MESIVHSYRQRGGDVFFVHVHHPVLNLMKAAGFYDYLGADHFLDPDKAIGYLFHRRLNPAVCIYECPIKVFGFCQNLPKRLDLVEAPVEIEIAQEAIPSIEARDLWEALLAKHPPVVIDVREPREFKTGHIPAARLLSLPALVADVTQVPRIAPVVLVCQGGRRSTRAAALLQQQGYVNVSVLQEGMIAWRREQLLEAVELRQ